MFYLPFFNELLYSVIRLLSFLKNLDGHKNINNKIWSCKFLFTLILVSCLKKNKKKHNSFHNYKNTTYSQRIVYVAKPVRMDFR